MGRWKAGGWGCSAASPHPVLGKPVTEPGLGGGSLPGIPLLVLWGGAVVSVGCSQACAHLASFFQNGGPGRWGERVKRSMCVWGGAHSLAEEGSTILPRSRERSLQVLLQAPLLQEPETLGATWGRDGANCDPNSLNARWGAGRGGQKRSSSEVPASGPGVGGWGARSCLAACAGAPRESVCISSAPLCEASGPPDLREKNRGEKQNPPQQQKKPDNTTPGARVCVALSQARPREAAPSSAGGSFAPCTPGRLFGGQVRRRESDRPGAGLGAGRESERKPDSQLTQTPADAKKNSSPPLQARLSSRRACGPGGGGGRRELRARGGGDSERPCKKKKRE